MRDAEAEAAAQTLLQVLAGLMDAEELRAICQRDYGTDPLAACRVMVRRGAWRAAHAPGREG